MRTFKVLAAAAATALSALIFASAGQAQSNWPTRTVNVIVPFAPGGGADPLSRLIFGDMAQRTGQAFPIDFRPGASGLVGTHAATRTDPDGYTILFTSPPPVVNARFYNPPAPYDPMADLIPIMQLTKTSSMIVASAKFKPNTFQELIDYAKANPGKVNMAVGAPGASVHLAASLIEYKAGVQFNKVPYTGAGAQQPDLISGVVDVGIGFPAGYLGAVKSGQLKFLAVMAEKRLDSLPDVQATDESSVKDVHDGSWFMAFVPKGTPREIVDRINAEFKTTLAKPEIKEKVTGMGYQIVASTSAEAIEQLKDEYDGVKAFVEETKYKF